MTATETAETAAAKDYKQAMDDARHGRISANEFRAFVRESKARHGLTIHEGAKCRAIAASNR